MHLNSEEALDLIEQRVSEGQASFWAAHFEICPGCSKQFNEWKEMHSLMKRSHLEDAPQAALERAEAIYRPTVSEKRSLRELIASVVFDSFSQPALAGARGGSGSRQFLLSADQFDIHVRISGTFPERRLAGQILCRSVRPLEGPVKLHLLQGNQRLETAVTDEFGEFHFAEVPAGPLSLQIDLPDLTVLGELG
jgi:hypothetical protein